MAYAKEVAAVIVKVTRSKFQLSSYDPELETRNRKVETLHMPLTLLPPVASREAALIRQLDGIAARLRRTVFLRSGSWLVALSVLYIGLLASLDARFQLPALVRALALAGY